MLLALYAGLKIWTAKELGFHRSGWARGLIFGVLLLAVELYGWCRESYGLEVSELAVLAASSFVVAIFEELMFRGVLYNALEGWRGRGTAVWGSTFVFMVFHVQAQDPSHFPAIFLTGLLWAIMRFQGVSLYWLILAHGTVDSAYFLGGWGDLDPGFTPVVYHGLLFLLCLSCWLTRSKRPASARLDAQKLPAAA
jgi:membrane protease YdiL (CAAX protease family)